MVELNSIGLIETPSIARGFVVQDAMVKTPGVELLMARPIHSGKFLVAVFGDAASVSAAVDAGAAAGNAAVADKRVIAHVHASVFPAIAGLTSLQPWQARALGVIETVSASSIIDVADAAAKSGDATLFRVHLESALGGKAFVLVSGDVPSVEAAVEAGRVVAERDGILVDRAVIGAPARELFRDFA